MANGGRKSNREVAATEVKVLYTIERYVHRHQGPSYREVGLSLGLSIYRVASSVKRLEEDGLVVVTPCYDEFGGRVANDVAITDLGYELMDRIDNCFYDILQEVTQK